MKRARLPEPIRVVMGFAELTFPKRHPAFDGERQIARSGEQMQMVRHQNVIPDQPRVGSTPCLREQAMRLVARQPGQTVLGASGYENNRWLIEINVNALGRFLA